MGFLLFLYGRASVRLIVAIVAVQPFADIVADYAMECFSRCKQGNNLKRPYAWRDIMPCMWSFQVKLNCFLIVF